MKIKNLMIRLLVVFMAMSFAVAPKAQAELPAKARAFITVTAYGAGGGALLGLASMAFGTSSRAIAQGASLGLYAGILFGTYVIVSHSYRRQGTYDDKSSPYREQGDDYYDDYGTGEENNSNDRGGFFDSSYRQKTVEKTLTISTNYMAIDQKKGGSQVPPLYVPVINYSF